MQRTLVTLMLTGLLVPGVAAAQSPEPPPRVLQIIREWVKPGKTPAHHRLEADWGRALAQAGMPGSMLAIESMTGQGEAWFITPFASWAEYEQSSNAFNTNPALVAVTARFNEPESELVSDVRFIVATFREDLSYLPSNRAPLPTMRFFSITRTQVRPGHTGEFEEGRRMAKKAHETAQLTDGYAIYQVNSGAPQGTFIQFAARKSMSELDGMAQIHGPAYTAALGGELGQQKLNALANSATISSEVNHFAFSPELSVPQKEWIALDPFWAPKPAPAGKKASERQ